MPSVICEYDLDTVYCKDNNVRISYVYKSIKQLLEGRGWARTQFSVYKKYATTWDSAETDLYEIAEAIEMQFFYGEQGIVRAFDFQRFTQETFVRRR